MQSENIPAVTTMGDFNYLVMVVSLLSLVTFIFLWLQPKREGYGLSRDVEKKIINLLMIGKTGHGKSSTANSILGRNEFEVSSSATSVTKICQTAWVEYSDMIVKVVDAPGICDTDFSTEESALDLMDKISGAVINISEGFHALLLVLRFGMRMTKEEEKAIIMLKSILGNSVIRDHCICILTYGDDFNEEVEEVSFENWCRRQEEFMQTVFKECDYRCVLFENKKADATVKKKQLGELISKVERIQQKTNCYTSAIFRGAKQEREKFLEEIQLPGFREDIMRDLSLLQGDFKGYINSGATKRQNALEIMKKKIKALKSKLDQNQYGGVDDLKKALTDFATLLQQKQSDERILEERKKFKALEQKYIAERKPHEEKMKHNTKKSLLSTCMNGLITVAPVIASIASEALLAGYPNTKPAVKVLIRGLPTLTTAIGQAVENDARNN